MPAAEHLGDAGAYQIVIVNQQHSFAGQWSFAARLHTAIRPRAMRIRKAVSASSAAMVEHCQRLSISVTLATELSGH
ncbi:hypothetical protein [Mycobacterium tuberculosis]|uniref:hypothetical protein n=1 Tax=Mycobacterium tuberculosis TaxID=1773 RepID=UPI00272B299C|nr:hypothetical protein [Mycobacterium tuberculosis]